MGKTILTFVRHAQGYHNLSHANEQIPDPDLTPLGESQCRALSATFPTPQRITHLVASPLRRTLYTCLLSFPSAVSRGLTVLAVPELQETSRQPCDTGSEPSKLRAEFATGPFAGTVDLFRVNQGWNSKEGRWSPSKEALTARALDARRILSRIAQETSEDKEIIIVTHGGFLHYLTDDWEGFDPSRGTAWLNTEYRSYEFVDPTGHDSNASLVETGESKARRAAAGNVVATAERTADHAAKL